ncbi:ABC transporter substrate-binding protein [Seleniivibrio woodruffii]|uniref:ABC transporter substrate-binding protein n=1 Tax=Seleniivibrio woodruffii TaxID=1078050 RepID=UPI0039E487DB
MKKIMAVLLTFACFSAFAADAPKKVGISQIVAHPALDAVQKGIIDAVEKCGMKNGKDVVFDVQLANGNMVTAGQIADKFVGDKKDLVVGIATPTALALASTFTKSSPKTPVIFSAVTDPVGAKLVKDIKKPGGNITGVSDMLPIDTQFQLIFDLGYKPKAVGIIYNAGEQNSRSQLELTRKAAAARKVKLVERAIASTADISAAANGLVGLVGAIFITTDNTVVSAMESVLKVAEANKIPVVMSDTDSVKRGALAAYGFDYYKHGLQTGNMVCRVLKGAKPAVTPVEFQKDLELVINEKAAAKIGAKIPAALLKKADEVIK